MVAILETHRCDFGRTTDARNNASYNKDLLDTGAFGDCSIRCRGRTYQVHRNILSPRCPFFKAIFKGNFAESASGTNEINMNGDDPDALEGLLYYLYTLDYPGENHEEVAAGSPSVFAYRYWNYEFLLYSIADKYNLPDLMSLARQSLLTKTTTINSPNEDSNRYAFEKSLDGFITLIENLYASDMTVSDDLRNLRTQIVRIMASMVACHIRDPRLSDLMTDFPEFGIDLVEALGQQRKQAELRAPQLLGAEKQRRVVHVPMNEDSDSECD